MKIAVAGTRGFPGVQGGVEKHCEKLYTQLAGMGCDITVFARRPYVEYDTETFNGIQMIAIDCPQNKFLEAIVHTFKAVLMARKTKPDILHIHAVGPSLFVPVSRVLGMKTVVTHHGPDYMRKKWPLPAKMFLRLCERMGMRYADGIITIAENIAGDIKRKYGRDSSVIPNGVEMPALRDRESSLISYGLKKKKYILAVGRFVPEKGFDVLIEAFGRADFAEWKLVVVGGADHEDRYSRELKKKAEDMENIVMTGFLTGDPLHELYTHAGLFVIPSYYEGLPIVLLEAMSYGLSCIASDIPANRNVELDEERFFSAGDADALMEKMKEYTVESWLDEDRDKQRTLVEEKYNWEKIASETMEVYKSIVR